MGGGYGSGAALLGTVTTGADGSFNLSSYTCPAGNPQTYITASGGNAGAGANSAIGLMAVLGPCASLSPSTTIAINELTTAAAEWALAQFFDSSGHTIGAPSTNATGLKNAYLGFANLADINSDTLAVSGNPSSLLPSPETCEAGFTSANCDALERLNTLANILAECVDSAPSSSACAQLFCDATPGLNYSGACSGTPAITDTMDAAQMIVANPASNVRALYRLALAGTQPFSPALGTAPDGWELALNFAPAGAALNDPFSIALDAAGDILVANDSAGGSVSELTAASGYGTGLSFAPAGAALSHPLSIALDGAGNVLVANCGSACSGAGIGGSVSELTAASGYGTGFSFAPAAAAFNDPVSIALDGSGNVLVANCGSACSGTGNSGSVSELTAASGYGTGVNFAPSGALFSVPGSIALDGSGNVFAPNGFNNSVSELTASSGYGTGFNFAPAGANLRSPGSITLDGSGDVFVENSSYSVSELTAASSYGVGLNFDPVGAELDYPYSIAVDGSGNVFVANLYDRVSELTAASGYNTGFDFAPPGAALDVAVSIAVDGSGNVFVANYGGSLSEFLGLAKPVITPVQSCLIFWANHPGQGCVP